MDSTESQTSLQPSISIESTNSDESDAVEKMHKQIEDISAQIDNILRMRCLKEISIPEEIRNAILELQDSIETISRSTKSMLTTSLEVPSGEPEYRSNPGRRRPTADSALGSSHYASTVSSRSARWSHDIRSGLESIDERTTRYVLETDFNRRQSGQDGTFGDPNSVPNDFSARTATENTESSESDNEKQPVYSSDESRLSSLPEKVEQSVQTDLSMSDEQTPRSVLVTEKFYKLELSDDNGHMPETNENQSASVTLQELSLDQSESHL